MRKSKKGIVLLVIGILFLSIAGVWIAKNISIDINAEKVAFQLLEKVIDEANRTTETSGDTEAVVVDGEEFCGRVLIEKLNLELPVYNEWSYEKLKSAPCRYKGSALTDNLVIAAHNYKSHFGNIDLLKENDEIVFIDANGNRYNYAVEQITKLDGTDVESMASDKWDFTLFTCTFDGSQRVTVRCNKSEN